MRENVKLAWASYCVPDTIASFDCYWCRNLTSTYSHVLSTGTTKGSDLSFVAVRDSSEIVVVFRGSQKLKKGISAVVNWLRDFEFWKDAWPFGGDIHNLSSSSSQPWVHHGFLECLLDIGPATAKNVENLIDDDNNKKIDKITIIGHSLGGGLSTVFALYLVQTTTNKRILDLQRTGSIRTFTLGSPRVGDDELYRMYGKFFGPGDGMRLVNMRDIVPGLPPRDIGYHHIPTEYWFKENWTSYVICDGSGEDHRCSDSIFRDHPDDHVTYTGVIYNDGLSSGC